VNNVAWTFAKILVKRLGRWHGDQRRQGLTKLGNDNTVSVVVGLIRLVRVPPDG